MDSAEEDDTITIQLPTEELPKKDQKKKRGPKKKENSKENEVKKQKSENKQHPKEKEEEKEDEQEEKKEEKKKEEEEQEEEKKEEEEHEDKKKEEKKKRGPKKKENLKEVTRTTRQKSGNKQDPKEKEQAEDKKEEEKEEKKEEKPKKRGRPKEETKENTPKKQKAEKEEKDPEMSWLDPVFKIGNISHYRGCTVDGISYFLNDTVYLAAGDEEEPFIGRIVALWDNPKTKRSKKSDPHCKIQWYYRQEQLPTKIKPKQKSDRHIIASDHFDDNNTIVLKGKCHVEKMKDIPHLEIYTQQDDHFYYDSIFLHKEEKLIDG